jgi:UDP-N-acetylglucosamine 2-epimerase
LKKFHLASYNRASDGAVAHLKDELRNRDALASEHGCDYVIAVGDRTETFDVVLRQWRFGIPVIHLWAGECCSDWSTEDEVYRTSMTLMSMMQLCTNETAKKRVESICRSVDKKPNAFVVGNVMLDDLSTDDSMRPLSDYILVLYNPPTLVPASEVQRDIQSIRKFIGSSHYFWIEPNGDRNSQMLSQYTTTPTLPRKMFLGLLKHCKFFVTNSSSQYYEAPFFLKPEQIIPVGRRNQERESKKAEMMTAGATSQILKILEEL